MGLAVAGQFATPFLVGWAIDAVSLAVDKDAAGPATTALLETHDARSSGDILWMAAGGCFAFTLLAGLFRYVAGRNAALASESIVRSLRESLYRRLERLPCSFYDRSETGDLVQRCTSDVETVRVFLSAQVVEIGRASLLFLVALPALFYLDAGMMLVSVALFPIIVGFAYRFFGDIKRLFKAQDESEGKLTTVLQENLTGIRVVRAFARQEFERDRFGQKNAHFRDETRSLISTLGTYWALSDLLCLAQVGIVLVVGAHWVASGKLTIGELNTFLMVQALVLWPMRSAGPDPE